MAAVIPYRILVGRKVAGDDAKQRPGRRFRRLKPGKEGTDVATNRTRTNGQRQRNPEEEEITMRTTKPGAIGLRQTWRNSLALTALAGAFAAALLALALSAPPAQSAERNATVPVTGGKTLLKLDDGTAAVLTDAGVGIRATRPALGGGTVFAFPGVGGEINKKQLSGRIVHSGGLAITAGDTTLIVKRFIIDLDTGYLTAKLAGAGIRIPLLRLGAVTGGVQAAPGVVVLRDVNVRLTGTAAGALNQTFNTNLFSGGLLIGQATVIATTRG
jgi:hypothetical protein